MTSEEGEKEANSFIPFESSISTDIKNKIIILKPIDNDILNMLTFGLKHLQPETSFSHSSFPPKLLSSHHHPYHSHRHHRNDPLCTVCHKELFYKDEEGFFQLCKQCSLLNLKLTIGKRYQIIEQIGKGSFSTTFKALDLFNTTRSNHLVAIKILNQNFMYIGITEIQILQFLQQKDSKQHFCFVKLIDKFLWQNTFLCLVEEYLEVVSIESSYFIPSNSTPSIGNSINKEAANFYNFEHYALSRMECLERVKRWKKVLVQSIKFLAFLRANEIIHADLKLDNCMFMFSSSLVVRFIDFGNSLHLSNASQYWNEFEIQSLAYRAPEVLFGCPFDCSIDMWSMGCLMSSLWLGKGIFEGVQDEIELCKLIFALLVQPIPESFMQGKFIGKYLQVYHEAAAEEQIEHYTLEKMLRMSGMPLDGINLLLEMLQIDPEKRIKPKDALLHPFLADFIEPILYCIM